MPTTWEELPLECTWTIGVAPNRINIGYAIEDGDAAVVIWRETELDMWQIACRIPARYAHYVVAAALDVRGLDLDELVRTTEEWRRAKK